MPPRKPPAPSARPALPNPADIPVDLRDRLSPVVTELYSAGDFHRVDMRSIAKAAGMSFRTIYQYFGDKESLLFWFIGHWLGDLYPAVLQELEGKRSLKAKLLAVLEAHLAFYEAHPNLGRIIFMTVPLERWMRDPSYAQSELMRRVLRLIKDAQQAGELRADIDSLVILDAWTAVFNRAFLMWEYRRRSYSLTAQAAPLFSILWNGIASPTGDAKTAPRKSPKRATSR
jgi:AcrR family transcriptional regulator